MNLLDYKREILGGVALVIVAFVLGASAPPGGYYAAAVSGGYDRYSTINEDYCERAQANYASALSAYQQSPTALNTWRLKRATELRNKYCGEEEGETVLCTDQYDPVCGADGNTYSNSCKAGQAGVEVAYEGKCQTTGTFGFGGWTGFNLFNRDNERGINLREYYPNESLYLTHYLEGTNSIGSSPGRSVLWFEGLGSGAFRQYNSAPGDSIARCHHDELAWDDNLLKYSTTSHNCPGDPSGKTVYSPAITFIPEVWDEGGWSQSGTSRVSHYENGELVCKGTTTWQASVVGKTQLRGEDVIQWRTRQTTKWDEFGNCAGGHTTRWQEDWWLGILGGQKGVLRSRGGNLDIEADRWDVRFSGWESLPSVVD